jgi:hypothetical protein
MKIWPLQDVKAQYSEFVDDDLSVASQLMTGCRVRVPVMGSVAPKPALMAPRSTLKALLLTDFARTEHLVPLRGEGRRLAASGGR